MKHSRPVINFGFNKIGVFCLQNQVKRDEGFLWDLIGHYEVLLESGITLYVLTQPSHDVRTTLLRRRFSVLTSSQRPYNVVLTSCAS